MASILYNFETMRVCTAGELLIVSFFGMTVLPQIWAPNSTFQSPGLLETILFHSAHCFAQFIIDLTNAIFMCGFISMTRLINMHHPTLGWVRTGFFFCQPPPFAVLRY